MKIAPLNKALRRDASFGVKFIHTGQHYSPEMSAFVMKDLELPTPDVHLGVGSNSHAHQTAAVMTAYEDFCIDNRPSCAIVVGDVNSTLAASLVAAKLGIPIAHLEAGLRSWDRSMPEEINRIVTDRLATLLWAPSQDAVENLVSEGCDEQRVELVGNIMIDAFEMLRDKITSAPSLVPGGEPYGVVTFYRPSNVDDARVLSAVVSSLVAISDLIPLLFPVHPRTEERLRASTMWDVLDNALNVHLIRPQGYVAFMGAVMQARLVITDSGGIQEETTYLGIPCLTLRANTERPITITHGTNRLVSSATLAHAVQEVLASASSAPIPLPFWDGHTADRVVSSLHRFV